MIDRFDGEFRFLSNFWPCAVRFEGLDFPSVEHAYQAAKTVDRVVRMRISTLTAGQAKRAGRQVAMRPDWDLVKIGVMRDLLEQKFAHPELRRMLEATRPRDLIEGNSWGDRFWGVCGGAGSNNLGKLLMAVRG